MKAIYDEMSYLTLVKEAMPIVYGMHREPRPVHYEEVVADLICIKQDIPKGSYTKRQVHTSVYRSLKWLVQHDEMISDGKYYWGFDEYALYRGHEDFKKNVKVAKNTIGIISHSTIAIALDKNHDMALSRQTIEKFFDENDIFATYLHENVLVIIFNEFGYPANMEEFYKCIKAAYDYHNGQAKKDG